MQDFRTYNYSINLEDVMQVLADAMQAGQNPQVVINGEYYDIINSTLTYGGYQELVQEKLGHFSVSEINKITFDCFIKKMTAEEAKTYINSFLN